MKNTISLREVFRESLFITWRQKGWWLLGLLAFFLSGSVGYQLIAQSIRNLSEPVEWVNRWQSLSAGASAMDLLRGQWSILMRDPGGWFALVGVWIAIGIVLFVLFSVSVYAVTVILSGIKVREQQGSMDARLSFREAWHHLRSMLAVVILTQIVSNLLLVLFSGPVLSLTVSSGGVLPAVALVLLFIVYIAAIAILAIWVVYTALSIVMYDLPLFKALRMGWIFLWRNWLVSLKLLLAQLAITVVATFLLSVAVSFIVIPVTIAGYILVANAQYDITALLPNLILILTFGGFILFGAVYTFFQLISWALLFLDAQEQGAAISVSIEEIEL